MALYLCSVNPHAGNLYAENGFGNWWGMGCGIWRWRRRIGVSFALWGRGGARGDVVGLAAFVQVDSFASSMWGM